MDVPYSSLFKTHSDPQTESSMKSEVDEHLSKIQKPQYGKENTHDAPWQDEVNDDLDGADGFVDSLELKREEEFIEKAKDAEMKKQIKEYKDAVSTIVIGKVSAEPEKDHSVVFFKKRKSKVDSDVISKKQRKGSVDEDTSRNDDNKQEKHEDSKPTSRPVHLFSIAEYSSDSEG